MVGRSRSFNEFTAKKFEKLEFAQNYLALVMQEEDIGLDEALRSAIRNMGIKAFSDKSGLSLQAVSDFVLGRQNWSTDKMAKHILQVFKMKLRYSLDIVAS